MPFLEAAEHINEKHSGLQDVRVLNTQTKIFQVGGLGLAGLLGTWAWPHRRASFYPLRMGHGRPAASNGSLPRPGPR